jgi:hypothetical protein
MTTKRREEKQDNHSKEKCSMTTVRRKEDDYSKGKVDYKICKSAGIGKVAVNRDEFEGITSNKSLCRASKLALKRGDEKKV